MYFLLRIFIYIYNIKYIFSIYRMLEKLLDSTLKYEAIINTLRKMNAMVVCEYGYIPNYTRTELTNILHNNAELYKSRKRINGLHLRQF